MIPQFAMRLICGLSVTWCLLPRREITSGYFRIQNLLCLGLGVLAALTSDQIEDEIGARVAVVAGTAAAIVAFLGSVFWTLERRNGGTRLAIVLATMASVTVLIVTRVSLSNVDDPGLLTLADSLSSALFMGAMTAAMLLGHWYLTATGMPIRPLIQFNQWAGVNALLRAAVALAVALQMKTFEAAWTLNALRWAGIIGPLLMVWLTIRILRYRNTQSATGVLYAATILVFMGEMAAALLFSSAASPAPT